MPETVFEESAAKVAIGFFSQIKVFENTAFGHVTEVPNIHFLKKQMHENCPGQLFSGEFSKIFKNTFLKNISG